MPADDGDARIKQDVLEVRAEQSNLPVDALAVDTVAALLFRQRRALPWSTLMSHIAGVFNFPEIVHLRGHRMERGAAASSEREPVVYRSDPREDLLQS